MASSVISGWGWYLRCDVPEKVTVHGVRACFHPPLLLLARYLKTNHTPSLHVLDRLGDFWSKILSYCIHKSCKSLNTPVLGLKKLYTPGPSSKNNCMYLVLYIHRLYWDSENYCYKHSHIYLDQCINWTYSVITGNYKLFKMLIALPKLFCNLILFLNLIFY